MENKKILVSYHDKKVEFPFSLDYTTFIKECQEKFNISNEEIGGINFLYEDEEGDLVSVSSVFDFDQAMKVMQGSDLQVLNFTLELKINQSFSLIPNVNQSLITDSMRSAAIFETESNILENFGDNNENHSEETEDEKGRKIKEELERNKEEQKKQEEETKKTIRDMIEKEKRKEEEKKKQEEERKRQKEEEERKRLEEERKRQEFERKQKEELLKAKKEEEERIRKQKEIEEKKKEEERIQREKEQKELKAIETFVQSKRKEKIIKLLKSNYTQNKRQEHLLKVSKISEKVITRDTMNIFKKLPPKHEKKEEEDIKIKIERKKRIMERINKKVHESFLQSKISQSVDPNKYQNEFNNEQYESTIENIKREAEQKLQSQVKLLEKEFEKMKKNLIQKTMEENNQILQTYVDKLSTFEKERQAIFQTHLSKIPQNKDNCNLSMSISAIHSNIKCELCSHQPIIGIRYKCAVCPNYNLCEECEEKNYETKAHPHDFIRIRDPRNDQIQMNGRYFSDNNQSRKKFSFKLLTKDLTLSVEKGSTKLFQHKLVLQNDYGMSWNEGTTFLKCDKLNSTIIAKDIGLPPLTSEQKGEVICSFCNFDTMEIGTYTCILHFNVDGYNYGDPITITINVINPIDPMDKKVTEFRKRYNFDQSYSDTDIKNALAKNNNDHEKAYTYLLNQIVS